MTQYYGTKVINAYPYIKDGIDGYKVIYQDGYESWSPKGVFEEAYQPTNRMSFGHAVEALKRGHKVARSGWNGKDMFLFLVKGSRVKVDSPPLLGIYEEGTEIEYHSYIHMKTAQGYVIPWLASQADILEDDWCIL